MAPRAHWKGYLKLSLVSCPIALYPAIAASEKVHAAADAKDFAKVDSSLKTLESTMAMVEKQLSAK